MQPTSQSATHFPAPLSAQPPIEMISSAGLFAGGKREIMIDHAGAVYRLRITRGGKLILTK